MSLKCISSLAMTELLAWSNPHGREEAWLFKPQASPGFFIPFCKAVVAELGLALLAVSSTVETVAYAALASLSLTCYLFTDRPYTFFASLWQSSTFTFIWSVADAIIYNPYSENILTQEAFARFYSFTIFSYLNIFMRNSDLLEVQEWTRQYRPEILKEMEDISKGAEFIATKVLAQVQPDKIQKFKDMDPGIFIYLLEKAVFIYSLGDQCHDPIPNYFKPETQVGILTLRTDINDISSDKQKNGLLSLIEKQESENLDQNDPLKIAYQKLRAVASEEQQNSLFLTKCYERALTQLG